MSWARPRRERGGVALALALTLAALFAGCGDAADEGSATPQAPEALLVDDEHIDAAAAAGGNPAANLMRWWRALQFDDARTASRFYAPGISSEARIEAQLDVAGPPSLALPEVQEIKIVGDNARLYVVIVSASVTEDGRIDTIFRRPATFHLVRERGRWLLAGNEFLADRAATALRERSSG